MLQGLHLPGRSSVCQVLRGCCSSKPLTKSMAPTNPFTIQEPLNTYTRERSTQEKSDRTKPIMHVLVAFEGRPALIKFLIKIFQKIAFWKPKSDHSLSIQWIPTGSSVRTKRRRPPEFSSWSPSPAFRLPNLQVPKQDATRNMRRVNKQTMPIPNTCPELATLRKTNKIHGFW